MDTLPLAPAHGPARCAVDDPDWTYQPGFSFCGAGFALEASVRRPDHLPVTPRSDVLPGAVAAHHPINTRSSHSARGPISTDRRRGVIGRSRSGDWQSESRAERAT